MENVEKFIEIAFEDDECFESCEMYEVDDGKEKNISIMTERIEK